MVRIIFQLLKSCFFKKSLNRSFQEIFARKYKINGTTVEFGAYKGSSKNFINLMNNSKNGKIIFCDKANRNAKLSQKEDLEKRISIKKNFCDNVILFNVLEHIYDCENAIKEIHRCLKKGGKLIGSVPFIHRIHHAPEDFNRYTPQYLNKILKKNKYKDIKIFCHGFGPVTASYAMVFDLIKHIPFLRVIILFISLVIDLFLSIFSNSKLDQIYPISISFEAKKK